jgi:putative ABC transport system permease protein
MAMLNKLRLRLRALFFKSKMEDELQAELQFHLKREIEENIARRMTPEDARYAALRSFGGVELVKEESRDLRGVRLLEEVWQDLCYGARILMKNYGFTLAAALCLGLGIGVNTAIFSVIHALLLRSFPVPQADQLVVITQGKLNLPITYRNFVRIRNNNGVLSDLAAFEYVRFSFGNRDQSQFISGELVSGNYFDALKLRPALGRTFLPEEDQIPDAHPVVVLSYRFWQSRLSGVPDVIGRTIILNRHRFTVIGVAPQGFKGMVTPYLTSVWIPLMMSARVKHEIKRADDIRDFEPDSADELRSFGRVSPIGRLRPGVSLSQAQAAIEIFSPRSDEPDEDSRFRLISPKGINDIANTGGMRRQVTKATTLMGVIAGIVLLIACSNLANLLLARASVRRKEIAIRMALGASRVRLIRLLMTESALLALAGGGVGLLVASLFNRLCIAFIPRMATFDPDLRLDAPVLGFTLLLSMGTSVLFGLAPALRVSKLNFAPALKDEIGIGALHTKTINLRNALVIGQVAISLPLLICAGLFIRSLQKEQAIDLGFKTENRLVLWLNLKVVGYDQTNGVKFVKQLLDRVRAVPGVQSASIARDIGGFSGSDCYSQDSARPSVDIPVFDCSNNAVGSQFFHTMGISVVRGREFTAQDGERGNKVVVINESLARRYWPGEDPLGKQLRIGESSNPLSEIVGIVKDSVDFGSMREEPPPMLYTPFQDTESMHLIIHTSIDPNGMIQPLRREISLLDENLPMRIATMNELISSSQWEQRLGVTLLSILGGLGLLLTAVGIYGVTAYIVAQRTREFGVRMALGARGRDVMKLVIREGMWLVLIGVVIGMAASLAVSRLLKGFLFGLSAADPMTFGIIPLLLAAVALLACYVPARRATKVDPMIALRSE